MSSQEPATSRPNILFVMTDQQRYDTIASLGNHHMVTPNLDLLVETGVTFERTYVTAPSCTPSRASMFTGLYPSGCGVLRNDEPWPSTWVEDLAEDGYYCVNIGKMHTFPYEAPFGFHERHVVENKDRGTPTVPFHFDNWDKALHANQVVKPDRRTLRSEPDYRERLGAFEWRLPEHLHADAFVGSLVVRWLDEFPGNEPFFLQVGFPGPHPPYDAPRRLLDLYQDSELPEVNRTESEFENMPSPIQSVRRAHLENDHDSVVHLENPTREQTRLQRIHYFANITLIDEQLGEIMAALERRGVLEDTVIVFTSDHGDALNDHGLSQKWTMYEPSVRVPAIVAWPQKFSGGRRLQELISHFDLGATVLEIAGVAQRPGVAARSLLGTLLGSTEWTGREAVFAEQARDSIQSESELMTMVVDGRWKCVSFKGSSEGQLFDLQNDPLEQENLWNNSAYASTREGLLERVHRWRSDEQFDAARWWTNMLARRVGGTAQRA